MNHSANTQNNSTQKLSKFLKGVAFSFSVSWKASKWLLIARIMIILFTALIPFATIFLGKEIINSLVSFAVKNEEPSKQTGYFIRLVASLFLVTALGHILQKAKDLCGSIHKDLISNYLNIQMADKFSKLDLSYFDSTKFYNEMTNAKRDSFALETLNWFVIDFMNGCIQFVIAAVILSRLNLVFTAILVATVLPVMIVEKRFTARLYFWQRDKVPEERKMNYILGLLTGRSFAKDIRLYGLQGEFTTRYQHIWSQWFREKKHLSIKKSKWAAGLSLIPDIGSYAILLYVGLKILSGQLTVGDYSLYSGTMMQLMGSIFMLVMLFTQIYENDIRLDNYKRFLQWESKLSEQGQQKPKMPLKIEFKNVSFQYPGVDQYILKSVNFVIHEGEKIALVGHNGAGKTTIVKLLLRFYDPTEGVILMNDIDIKEYDVDAYRKCFSAMFQDYANYAFTLKENITLSDIHAADDDRRIGDACNKSNLDGVIRKFNDDLGTYLTREFEESGRELSGGEWQRVALARTFYRDGSIVILDEPSAALDPEAEHEVFEKFLELCKGKGAVLISHRLSNVTMVDRILVFEQGQLIENGAHAQLMRDAGRYAYLFNLQADKYKTVCS